MTKATYRHGTYDLRTPVSWSVMPVRQAMTAQEQNRRAEA